MTLNVKKIYDDLARTSFMLYLLRSILTASVFFSICYFLLNFFIFSKLLAIPFSIIYFFVHFFTTIKKDRIVDIEHRYPLVKEKLRTSRDNKDVSNEVVDSLHEEVLSYLSHFKIKISYINFVYVISKITFVIFIFYVTMAFSLHEINAISVRENIVNSRAYEVVGEPITDIMNSLTSDIFEFEEEREIPLGTEEKNFTLDVFSTELDTLTIKKPLINDYGGHFPSEIGGFAQENYQEDIPLAHKEIVKSYFIKINNNNS